MGHFDLNAKPLLAVHDSEGLHVAIQHVVSIVGSIDEIDGNPAARQKTARVIRFHPFRCAVAELVDTGFLHGFTLVKKA